MKEAEKRLINFASKIKVCPNWHPENVCKRRKICQQKRGLSIVFVLTQTFMKNECPCAVIERTSMSAVKIIVRWTSIIAMNLIKFTNLIKHAEKNLINSLKERSFNNRF